MVWFNLFTLRERGGFSREYFLDPLHLVSTFGDGVLVLRMGSGWLGLCSDRFREDVSVVEPGIRWLGFVEHARRCDSARVNCR